MIINFAYRIQGMILAANNPMHVTGIEDVARRDIRIVNRQSGTGTRLLLEYELEKHGIDVQVIQGYDNICLSHLDVGIEILSGRADTGLGIQAIAQMLGLDFIPLRKERFDLIIRKETFTDFKIQTLINFLRSKDTIEYSKRFVGYDLKDTGRIIYQG